MAPREAVRPLVSLPTAPHPRSQDHYVRDPFGLEHTRAVGSDQPDRISVIEIELLAVQLEGQQGVGIIGMFAVYDRGGIEAVLAL